ncbi:MAG: porin [Thauera sp.]|jgi:predicted porin
MQKKLIALAIAGLVSAPAFAQSNVTIYGIADAYLAFGKQGGYDLAGVQSGGLSGSRLGFRGAEDLGNGLKAVFVLEQGYNIDSGTDLVSDKAFSRQAYVGVGGSFGTVSLGRQYAPGYDQLYDALVSSNMSPQAVLAADSGSTIAPNTNARWSNSVAYKGTFSGLTARGIYSMGTEANGRTPMEGVATVADPSDDDAYGLGLDYSNGPLTVGAVYQAVDGNNDQTEWLVGGGYDFGVVKLLGSYQDSENLRGINGNDADQWQLGVIVPVSAAGNVHLAYGELDYDGVADGKAKSIGLAYTHAMSKRTTAYAAYNFVDNGNDTNAGIGAADAGGTAHFGKESHVYLVGVRHTF